LQVYFSLEDFFLTEEGVLRNTGVFKVSHNDLQPKLILNTFKALTLLGDKFYLDSLKLKDEFVGLIATKRKEGYAILIYNYIDPEYLLNFFSRFVVLLNPREQRFILECIQSQELEKIVSQERFSFSVSALGYIVKLLTSPWRIFFGKETSNLKELLDKAKKLQNKVNIYKSNPRLLKINLKNFLSGEYLFRIYTVKKDSSLDFLPVEEKEQLIQNGHTEVLALEPYSISLLVIEKKN
ncbi:MAG: hypothetical protein N2Z79_05105, partial [Candidatus Omnitrophica bacterium]|nr:hypothetical protein [Candidatus Omnitrophota bacterium]